MEASQTQITSGSIKPFISGEFGTSAAIDSLSHDYIDGIVEIIEDLMDLSTSELQDEARMDPEWAPYHPYLKVEVEYGEIQYMFDASSRTENEMTNLEYGTPEASPNPLVRTFAVTDSQVFSKSLKDRMKQELYLG